jgi:hypothetical protein
MLGYPNVPKSCHPDRSEAERRNLVFLQQKQHTRFLDSRRKASLARNDVVYLSGYTNWGTGIESGFLYMTLQKLLRELLGHKTINSARLGSSTET